MPLKGIQSALHWTNCCNCDAAVQFRKLSIITLDNLNSTVDAVQNAIVPLLTWSRDPKQVQETR